MRQDYKVLLTLIIIIAFAGILLFNISPMLNATEDAPPCEQRTDQGCIMEIPKPKTTCSNTTPPFTLDAAKQQGDFSHEK